ncbi:hypothetical protein NDI76_03365 [Halogeometricum sp. S1BR25-6]|uniref:Uncharacterized protein n=1 Tax=Halogeometricum salsisoli TaxID=2950536 RepID=A0ABU2GAG5_9EURY|nr:hypothetical protein [Halogeometricum sp. S1BR25-6]MDS0297772.1 hypothetical protein [Halogeometricum sp. S1BR25-6]
MTDKYEHCLGTLTDALDENTKSKAIDRAIVFTLQIREDLVAHPTGKFDELIETAEERRSLTGEGLSKHSISEIFQLSTSLSGPSGTL